MFYRERDYLNHFLVNKSAWRRKTRSGTTRNGSIHPIKSNNTFYSILGVYKHKIVANVYVDISNIVELRAHKINENSLALGANVTLTNAMRTFKRLSMSNKEFAYLGEMANHIDLVATVPVRNVSRIFEFKNSLL